MNINRNNYEEYFLMYVDKELSAAERKSVELFVQENPDLKAELLLLQDSVLSPAPISFDKSFLLKDEEFAALQEKLVLYGDKELDKKESALVQSLLKTDKAAAAEWEILQSTRLHPETVVFEDKASLYREEPGRVVAFKWWRVAAAAVLLGFGIWTGVSVYNNKSTPAASGDGMARQNGQPVKQDANPVNIAGVHQGNDTNTDTNTNTTNPNGNDVATTGSDHTHNKVTTDPGKTTTGDHNNSNNTVTPAVQRLQVKDNSSLVTNETGNEPQQQKPSNNLPKAYFENINKRESNTTASVNVPPVEDNSRSGTVIPSNNKPEINNSQPNTNPYAKLASADENVNYLEEDRNKKTKLGGFFRKVRRVLERSANIKTGEGIQIAGFEIAAK